MSNDILTDRRDGVDARASLNTCDMAMEAELDDRVRTLAVQDETRAIVLTGAGDRAFCAGQDLTEAQQFNPDTVDDWLETSAGCTRPSSASTSRSSLRSTASPRVLAPRRDLDLGHSPQVRCVMTLPWGDVSL